MKSYLRFRRDAVLTVSLTMILLAAVFDLFALSWRIYFYFAALLLFFLLLTALFDYQRYRQSKEKVEKMLANSTSDNFTFPAAPDDISRDYQKLIAAMAGQRADLRTRAENEAVSREDYYLLWTHQIKTPIAAANLLLQSGRLNRSELQGQLFSISRYVEMALTYNRLTAPQTDLVFKIYDLDGIIQTQIHNYAPLFIRRHIKLDYQPAGRRILTDSKWLGFVIGQLLDNAIKYTPDQGRITIRCQAEKLFISDTGIGISASDLPRLGEKGFTGNNGRYDKKASGLGLYLCKSIMTRLNQTLTIESEPGQGTTVMLTIADGPAVIE